MNLKAPLEVCSMEQGELPALLKIRLLALEQLYNEMRAEETEVFNSVMSTLAVELETSIFIEGNWEYDDRGVDYFYWTVCGKEPHPAIAYMDEVAMASLRSVWNKDGTVSDEQV